MFNLNNHPDLKRNLVNRLREDIPDFADDIIKERNLYKMRTVTVCVNKKGNITKEFFGNSYDRDYINDLLCWSRNIDVNVVAIYR